METAKNRLRTSHSAILSSWGKPTLGFENVVDAGKAGKEIEPIILQTKPTQAELAITYSDRARVFFLTESLERIDYIQVMEKLHNIFWIWEFTEIQYLKVLI